MSSKRKVSLPSNIDKASGDSKNWYIDFYTRGGQMMHKCHLFIAETQGDDTWEDLGQIKSLSISSVDLHQEIECIDVEVSGNLAYQLAPQAYIQDNMVKDKEETMFSRGWSLDASSSNNITINSLYDALAATIKKKPKKLQESQTSKKKIKYLPGEPSSQGKIKDVDQVNLADANISLDIINPKLLAKKKGKCKEEPLGSIDQYKEYFQFGVFKEFEIPVLNCWEAPNHYLCRTLDDVEVSKRLQGYTSHKNRPASCAYLMPILYTGKKCGTPLTKEAVSEGKLHEYAYWIIDGQHSIYAAKVVMLNRLPPEMMDLKDIYRFRKARIVVNAPAEVCVAISRLANLEAQAVFKKQPYGEILKHLRAQWMYYNKPTRPAPGLTKGHPSRVDWDKFITSAERSMGEYFAQKQAHMVTCSEDIFLQWMEIIQQVEKGSLSGKKPNQTQFRCLAGLEETEIRTLQSQLKSELIVLSKDAASEDKVDLVARVMVMKQDKVAQQELVQELLKEFNTLNLSHKCQSWYEVKVFYSITDKVYSNFQHMCDTWIKAKLQVGKANSEFSMEVKNYIKWIIALSNIKESAYDYPWKVLSVSLGMEGRSFMARHISHPIPIGLCVLDTTEGEANMMQWTENNLLDLLQGVMDVTGGTGYHQFVFLSFLKFRELVCLHAALEKLGGWSRLFYGSIDFLKNVPCNGAAQLFSVLVYVSNTDSFEGFGEFASLDGPTLDAALLEIDFNKVKDMNPREFLRHKKAKVITKCIQRHCMGDLMLIDAFSDGFVARHGLKEKRDVYCLVETIEEIEVLRSDLLQYAKSSEEIRMWARIPSEELPLVQVVQPINTILGEASYSLPMENSTNELLDFDNLSSATASLLALERGTGSSNQEDPIIACAAPYVISKDPLGTPIFPIPIDSFFQINGVTFKVQASTIHGAGLGLFLYSSLCKGVNILHYGGDKYHGTDWKDLCHRSPRASKYSMIEDPRVDCADDWLYIVGDVNNGNVAGYINSCHGMPMGPNVRYVLDPSLPPWHDTIVNSNDYGFICVETMSDINVGQELFAEYEFL